MKKSKFEYAEYEGNYFRWEVGDVVMDILRGDTWESYTGSSPVQTLGSPVDEDKISSITGQARRRATERHAGHC